MNEKRNLPGIGNRLYLSGWYGVFCWFWLVCFFGSTFLGCAPAPAKNQALKSELKNDFASGVSAVVDYATNKDRALLLLEITNTRQKSINVWMIHEQKTDGSEVFRRDRIYQGDAKFISKNFRLPIVGAGIKETIVFKVSDITGAPLMQTDAIVNFKKGVQP